MTPTGPDNVTTDRSFQHIDCMVSRVEIKHVFEQLWK